MMFHVNVLSAFNLGYDLGEILFSGHGTFRLEWERTRMCQTCSDCFLITWLPGLFPRHKGAGDMKASADFSLMPR
jgi:hypothetical protein